jgi:hypothetical protein
MKKLITKMSKRLGMGLIVGLTLVNIQARTVTFTGVNTNFATKDNVTLTKSTSSSNQQISCLNSSSISYSSLNGATTYIKVDLALSTEKIDNIKITWKAGTANTNLLYFWGESISLATDVWNVTNGNWKQSNAITTANGTSCQETVSFTNLTKSFVVCRRIVINSTNFPENTFLTSIAGRMNNTTNTTYPTAFGTANTSYIGEIVVTISDIQTCTAPASKTVSGNATICSGSSTNVTLTAAQNNVSYDLYKDGSKVASTSQTGNGTDNLTWSVSTAGTYTVKSNSSTGGFCDAVLMSGSAVITVTQPPTTSSNGGNQSIVEGATTTSLGGNTPSIGTGAWSITSGGTGTFSNSASGSSTFTPTGGIGDYELTWTISNSPCTASTSSLTVSVAPNTTPVISLTSGSTNQNISVGTAIGDIIYTWSGSATSATVAWTGTSGSSTPPTGISVSDNSGSGPVTISGSPSVAGTYGYSITSSDGSNTSSALTGIITVKLSTPDVSSGATTITNQGFAAQWADVADESSYTVNVYNGATLTTSVTDISANATSQAITGLSANTTYTYKVVAVGNGGTIPNSNESAASANVRTLNTAKNITVFSITGQNSSTINGLNISISMPYGTTVTSLTPSITHTGASISPTGAQDFTSPVQYTVTAEDGSTQMYTATVSFGTSATDNFRSKADGVWNDASPGNVWESSSDNLTWYSSTLTPGTSAASVAIKNNIIISSAITTNDITVDNGAKLSVNSGGTLTLNATKTLTVNGTLENGVTSATNPFSGGTIIINGTFDLTAAATTLAVYIPTATWGGSSTCRISGLVGTATGSAGVDYNLLNGVAQSFNIFEVNMPNF